jgi:polyhydroxyalkanoate synthesis regulator phasin
MQKEESGESNDDVKKELQSSEKNGGEKRMDRLRDATQAD